MSHTIIILATCLFLSLAVTSWKVQLHPFYPRDCLHLYFFVDASWEPDLLLQCWNTVVAIAVVAWIAAERGP